MHYRLGLIGAALISLVANTPANAAPKYFEDCIAPDSTLYLRIESCTFSLRADSLDDKQRVQALLSRAKGYAAQFWANDANADLAEAKRLAPDDPAVTAAIADLAHFIGGKQDRAIAGYKETLQQNDKDADTWVKLGMSYLMKKDNDRAFESFNKALEVDPNHVKALAWRSTFYTQQMKLDLALADLERAVAIAPDDMMARTYRGQSLLYAGKFDRAIEDLNFTLKAAPNSPLYRFRAVAEYLTGNLPAADADFLHDLKVDPIYANLAAWRLFVAQRRGGDDSAEMLQIVTALDGRWPAALLKVLLDQATIEDALAAAATAPSPELRKVRESQAHAIIGEWLLLRDDKAGAVTHFKAAVERGLATATEEANNVRAMFPSDTVVEFTLARARLQELAQ